MLLPMLVFSLYLGLFGSIYLWMGLDSLRESLNILESFLACADSLHVDL